MYIYIYIITHMLYINQTYIYRYNIIHPLAARGQLVLQRPADLGPEGLR